MKILRCILWADAIILFIMTIGFIITNEIDNAMHNVVALLFVIFLIILLSKK